MASQQQQQQQHQQQYEPPTELLESVGRKASLTTGERSPGAYQRIEISYPNDEDQHEQQKQQRNASLRSVNSKSSMASVGGKARKFACQFDPAEKNGRALVLRFDEKGVGEFQEITRLELLRLTQEAAKPNVSPSLGDEAGVLNEEEENRGSTRRIKARKTALRRPFADHGDKNAPYATICDVQRVHARDIRKLDNAFAVSNEPSFIIRKQAILVNADPLRVIIMRNSCLVFVPDGADSLLSILKEKFLETTQHESAAEVAYEFKALEALLATLCQYFEIDYEKNAPVVTSALDRLAHGKISASELETLRVFKNTMHEFESQVDGVRRALMEILDNEEDLRLLYLTKLQEDPTLLNDLWSFDSEEAEVLIENYLQDIFSTRTKASLMQHRIQNTESLVMLKLDSMRNYLLGVDLVFSLVVISLSIGTFITGVFGMNLDSHLQLRAGWFWSVVAATLCIFIVLITAGIQFFRKKGVLSWREAIN
ncbi:Cora metal ion transporter [Globisporangium polare]